MMQFKAYGGIPKSYHDAKVKCITTRNTLYAIHKEHEKTSKTHIICFTENRHVGLFKDYLVNIQKKGVLDRCSEYNSFVIPFSDAHGSTYPLSIVEYPLIHLMKTCHLNYFDMYVVFDFALENYDIATLHYYNFESVEYPHRGYLNCHLTHMMR